MWTKNECKQIRQATARCALSLALLQKLLGVRGDGSPHPFTPEEFDALFADLDFRFHKQ
jgi:hypothetical protein